MCYNTFVVELQCSKATMPLQAPVENRVLQPPFEQRWLHLVVVGPQLRVDAERSAATMPLQAPVEPRNPETWEQQQQPAVKTTHSYL